MDLERVRTIDEWPVPRSFKEIQIFLGFINFYRRFIFRYSVLTTAITDLLKGMQNGKNTGLFLFIQEVHKAFQELKQVFRHAPLLRHFDLEKPIKLEIDASLFAAGAVLSQPWDDGDGNDYVNLHNFMKPSTKIAQRHHVCWIEFLAGFDFEILYRTGKSNPEDGPSRQPDYQHSAAAQSKESVSSQKKAAPRSDDSDTTLEDISEIEEQPQETGEDEPVYLSPHLSVRELTQGETAFTNSLARMRERLLDLQRGDALTKEKVNSLKRGDAGGEWEKGDDQILRFNGTIYVPNDPALRQKLLRIYHDDLLSGHFGEKKMLVVLRTKYFWPKMQKSIATYCKTCQSCQKGKARTHTPYGTLATLPKPT
ncbi:hypothetical protein VTO42DRAFT_2564 [Malbranchea cinnamomea]